MEKHWQKARFSGFRNRYCSEKLEFTEVLAHFSHFIVFERWSIDAISDSKLEIMAYISLCRGKTSRFFYNSRFRMTQGSPPRSVAENLAISPSDVSKGAAPLCRRWTAVHR